MIKIHALKSHPRYLSNYYRDLLADGVKRGLVSLQGLTAHGRGEAFDYLLGEKTEKFSLNSIKAAGSLLLLAKYPVISVNGNTVIMVGEKLIALAKILNAKLEVNLFHHSKSREKKIASHLKSLGATEILLPDQTIIPNIESTRKMVSFFGQKKADVIFVPLEDGDRTQALISIGKKVITVDLNPLSRTAQTATITIVDNIVRTLPLLINYIKKYRFSSHEKLEQIVESFDNQKNLAEVLKFLPKRLAGLAKE